jgi:SAM-dependent methyltransferase
MSDEAHWETVYRQKKGTDVSWFRPHLSQSLALIAECRLPASAAIVDVGGGASTLVDDLLDLGFVDLTVIDLASAAFEQSKGRLGDRSTRVRWLQGDVTTALLDEQSVALWHDRAVFHFLTDERRRAAYLEQIRRSVRPGGFAILSTFALDGPERCSGLPVARYSPGQLADLLGSSFEKCAEAREEHLTPWGSPQPFSYLLAKRTSS